MKHTFLHRLIPSELIDTIRYLVVNPIQWVQRFLCLQPTITMKTKINFSLNLLLMIILIGTLPQRYRDSLEDVFHTMHFWLVHCNVYMMFNVSISYLIIFHVSNKYALNSHPLLHQLLFSSPIWRQSILFYHRIEKIARSTTSFLISSLFTGQTKSIIPCTLIDVHPHFAPILQEVQQASPIRSRYSSVSMGVWLPFFVYFHPFSSMSSSTLQPIQWKALRSVVGRRQYDIIKQFFCYFQSHACNPVSIWFNGFHVWTFLN